MKMFIPSGHLLKKFFSYFLGYPMKIRLFFDWCKNGMIGVHIVNKMVSKEKEPAQ